ncbi:unnamed protein product [Adineta steineri]|uniref:WSC domain-containing protein n=1 Tax=Adineta steineri TaxID=433720 RepID=A0A814MMV3_9BILA|nr:unnamed protein product [Adineta steineri]
MRALFLLYYLFVQLTFTYSLNQYLGCFIDQLDNRDLQIFIGDYEQLTPAQCIIACRERNYDYAGIQYGNECRCGQQYGKYGRVSEDECNYACKTSEKCGGDYRNSIYSVIESVDRSKTDAICLNTVVGYQGCFSDATLITLTGFVNSIEECVSRCAINYNYAGIVNGNLCHCGDDLNEPSVNTILCNIPCNGSRNNMTIDCCGGLDVLSVYDVKSYQYPSSDDRSKINVRDGDPTAITQETSSHASVITTATTLSLNVTDHASTTSHNFNLSDSSTASTLTTPHITIDANSTIGLLLTSIQSSNTTSSVTLSNTSFITTVPNTDTSTVHQTDSTHLTNTTTITVAITQSSSHIDTLPTTISTTKSISTTILTAQSSPHTDAAQTNIITIPISSSSPHTDATTTVTTGISSSAAHTDTSHIIDIITSNTIPITQSSTVILNTQSSSHIGVSQDTSTSTFLSTHIDTTTIANTGITNTMTISTSPTISTSQSSSLHADTSTITYTTLHMDTTQTMTNSAVSTITTLPTSLLTIISSSLSHTDTSVTSVLSSSLHTDTSQTHTDTSPSTITVISSSPITATSSTESSITSSVATSTIASQTTTILSTSSSTVAASVTTTQTAASTLITTSITNTTSATVVTSSILSSASVTVSATSSLTTTTPSQTYSIFTVFKVFSPAVFNPNNSTHVAAIQQGLVKVITVGFSCLNDSSNPQCISSRRRRQACPAYSVNIIPPITLISNNGVNPQLYRVNYTVSDLCTAGLISATQVKEATDKVPTDQKVALLGYTVDGDLVQSSSITTEPAVSAPDSKLWIIGAVLGPIAFVLLLIGICCFLYFKCRPRGNNPSTAQAVYNAPRMSRVQDYQTIPADKKRDQATPANNFRVLTQNDVHTSNTASAQHFTPIELQKPLNNQPQYPASVEIPMQEIRRQNDVERWRNKLRLQEKFEERYADPITDLDRLHNSSMENKITPPNTNRSMPLQHDTRAFEANVSNMFIQPVNEMNMYGQTLAARRRPLASEIEEGRNQLHRLLDEVLDKTEPIQPIPPYNPDSETERRKNRRQRRRVHSTTYDPRSSSIGPGNLHGHHIPVIPELSERPDPSLLRHHYSPYEAGDRAYEIERYAPVALKPKYTSDDTDIRQRYGQSSYRSNPPLFYDDSRLTAENVIAPDVYTVQNHQTRMRHNLQRQHRFNENEVYIDTIPKQRDGPRLLVQNAWSTSEEDNNNAFQLKPSDLNNDAPKRNDFHDEYLIAKQSVVNTKNLISSIQDELQQIVGEPPSDNYHA